jgi:hypothetical protein
MGIYVYIGIAMLVASVIARRVQPGERLNDIVRIVLVAVVWPLWLALYVLTVAFEYRVREQDVRRQKRRH